MTHVAGSSLQCSVRVRRDEPVAVPRLVVVQAIPKGDHADRAVDLLTEVGVDVIVPWAAARAIVRWRGDRERRGVERWRSVSVTASKQSRRLRFPEVRQVHTTDGVAELLAGADLAVVLHESAETPLAELLADSRFGPVPAGVGDVVLAVGPEGGLTTAEIAQFEAAGAAVARLGPTVLRSSAAGVVAASLVLARSDRWR